MALVLRDSGEYSRALLFGELDTGDVQIDGEPGAWIRHHAAQMEEDERIHVAAEAAAQTIVEDDKTAWQRSADESVAAYAKIKRLSLSSWARRLVRRAALYARPLGITPPTALAESLAQEFLVGCLSIGLLPIRSLRVAASVVGGIGITVRKGNREAYAEFRNHGNSILVLDDDSDEDATILRLKPEEFGLQARRIQGFLDG